MNALIDKLVIFIVSLTLYVSHTDRAYMVMTILGVIILSAALSYWEIHSITIAAFTAYLIACFIHSDFLFFIPLISYDAMLIRTRWVWGLSFLSLIVSSAENPSFLKWLLAAFILAVYVLKHRTLSLQRMEAEYHKLRDNAKEISMQLEIQNKELLDKQDYEINLATVTERNRIARDIHDNVGHLLSRSILQVGALLAINKDSGTKESLNLVKDTLSEAMDSIRASVHDLHEKSIDLHTQMQKLIEGFEFCPITFHYELETNLEKNLKYCFIMVTKEALSNIIKHSNATQASVTIREHPALYQLVIEDNGTQISYSSENGIGIKNITDRVSSVDGNVNIRTDKGFRIFISIPKKSGLPSSKPN